MVKLSLKIIDKEGRILAESSGVDCVSMLYEAEYTEGDRIVLFASKHDIPILWQVDDALGPALCYITEDITYQIPFGEKKSVYSPKTFSGNRHYLCVRIAKEREIRRYRNLAVNCADQHDVQGCYPHASANVETRGESVFAARNAIDGICENHGHGQWPYASWGINRDPNAQMRVEFGRKVWIDCIEIYLRADFPHDSYWTEGTVCFSDGSCEVLNFQKTDRGQVFSMEPREIEWLTFGTLRKADDESPFPALTQMEVYGKDIV